MEKSTITIEIKQEVSIILLWLVGGIIFVSIAIFIPSQSTELWPQFYAAGVAVVVYLFALLIYAVRKPIAIKTRVIAIVCFTITLVTLVFASIQTDSRHHWQTNKMMQIRGIIGRQMMMNRMQLLLLSLNDFFQQGPTKKGNLAQIFQQRYKNTSVGSDINIVPSDDRIKIFIQTLESDRVILISQDTYAKGKNPLFKNHNGQQGMIQARCVLTAKEITYESEN